MSKMCSSSSSRSHSIKDCGNKAEAGRESKRCSSGRNSARKSASR